MQTRMLTRFFAAAALAVVAVIAPLAAQNRPAPAASDIPKIPFEKYTLPNGLDVILSQDHRLPIVAVNLWYHVGPANEEASRTGFAHFEHLMFQARSTRRQTRTSRCSRPPGPPASTARPTTTQ